MDFTTPKVSGHSGAVLDIKWNPFNDDFIASASDDCTVRHGTFFVCPLCWIVFSQPTLLECLLSAHSVGLCSLSPLCWIVFSQPTLLDCVLSAHSVGLCSLSPLCWIVFSQPTLLDCVLSAHSVGLCSLSPL